MSRSRLSLLAALVALAAPLGAQQAAAPEAPRAAALSAPVTTPAAARSMVEAPAPVAASREQAAEPRVEDAFRAARAREAGVAVAQAGSQRDGKVYMIVGGAAFLAGAIIGDDAGTIIMIGGAAVGIYGLYLYLQ